MKIIHVCNYFQSNFGYQETYLALEQAKLGYEVIILTSDRYFPFPDYEDTVGGILGKRKTYSGIFDFNGIKIIRLKSVFEVKCRVWLYSLNSTINSICPEIIICHGITNFAFIRLLFNRKFKGRLIVDDHMLSNQVDSSDLGKFFYYLFTQI